MIYLITAVIFSYGTLIFWFFYRIIMDKSEQMEN